MKMLKKVAPVIAVVALGGLAACSYGHKGLDENAVRKHAVSKLDDIGATDAQKAKICPLVEEVISDCRDLHQRHKGVLRKMLGCLLMEKPDAAWLHRTVDEIAQDGTAFMHRSVDNFIGISAALDVKQRAKLQKRVEKAMNSHE